MGGVAAMISSVVSHTANVANATAGGKIPRSTTFGKRNIKNQVSFPHTLGFNFLKKCKKAAGRN